MGLDAELVVPDDRGHPVWDLVRARACTRLPDSIAKAAREHRAALCAFDVLWWDGQDVREWPLVERKVLLAEILPTAGTIHRLTWIEAHGEALFNTAVERDLEGIVAKRLDAPYKAGRQNCWLKIKNRDYSRQEALGWGR